MNTEESSLEKRKNLLGALAPSGVREAIGKIKQKLIPPKEGIELANLAKSLVKRRSAKK